MKCALAILAKSPVRGTVKTRLCPPLTPEQATELYRAFLLDTMHIISAIDGIEPGVLFTPDGARGDFEALVPSHFFLLPQRGDGFGARMANGFHDLFTLGYEAVAIMDADSPTLPRAHVAGLFAQLSSAHIHASVGPCDDGGYWALGMKRLHPELLTGITWSSELVLGETLQHAQAAGLNAVCAGTWYDVDNGQALEQLRRELAASLPSAPEAETPVHTIRALRAIGAASSERAQQLDGPAPRVSEGETHVR